MKQVLFIAITMFALSMTFTACDNSSAAGKDSDTEQVDPNGPEYTSKYICPMHCKGSGSDQAGTCPVCKMEYVMNEDFEGEAASEEMESEGDNMEEGSMEGSDMENSESEDGHDHDSHEGHNH